VAGRFTPSHKKRKQIQRRAAGRKNKTQEEIERFREDRRGEEKVKDGELEKGATPTTHAFSFILG